MKDVFVFHPRTQHSQQLAWALHERQLLQGFWSGVPVREINKNPPFWLPKYYAERLKEVDIPEKLRRHPLFIQALWRAGRFIPNGLIGGDFNHKVFHLFDRWVSLHIPFLKPRVVVGFEGSAYHTFLAAKAIGARCILDAPSFHHCTIERLIPSNPTPQSIDNNRRVDCEIAMADMILTCSPLAEESYITANVAQNKIKSVLLGATLPAGIDNWCAHTNPVSFIFAGGIRYLKGIDIILAVFRRLESESVPFNLYFVGGAAEPQWIKRIKEVPGAVYYPGVSQNELYKMLAKADCLLLPSRFDSFGMVVAEAFACGTPAIVSTQTGAKAMIEQFPNAGWIVSGDEDSLYSCVKARIQNRQELFHARRYALEASRSFTWKAYRARVATVIEDWLKKC